MKTRALLTIAAAFFLAAGIGTAAASTTTKTTSAKMPTHHLMGMIDSVNASDLVVAHKYKDKKKTTTFMLNSSTKKEGSLAKGDEATVYYRVNNKENIATEVKTSTAKKS